MIYLQFSKVGIIETRKQTGVLIEKNRVACIITFFNYAKKCVLDRLCEYSQVTKPLSDLKSGIFNNVQIFKPLIEMTHSVRSAADDI